MSSGPAPIFFIGFNKCATRSMATYFRDRGVDCFHGGLNPEGIKRVEQILINLAYDREPLDQLQRHDVWIALAPLQREFRAFASAYPDARYVLQTRNVDRWIVSRLNMLHGRYPRLMSLFYRVERSWQEWAELWREEWHDHERAVANHFGNRDTFLRYDIEVDPLPKLMQFCGVPSTDQTLPRLYPTGEIYFQIDHGRIVQVAEIAPTDGRERR